jgi:hypothetical protein
MSYTYPHWYSQKGERFPWHLSKTKRMSTTRHHHLDVEKTCAKPLVSAAWVKQLNSYSDSLLSLLSFYFYKSLSQDGRYSNVWLWSNGEMSANDGMEFHGDKNPRRRGTSCLEMPRRAPPWGNWRNRSCLCRSCAVVDGLWVGMGRTPKKELKGTQRTSVECWEKKYDYLR